MIIITTRTLLAHDEDAAVIAKALSKCTTIESKSFDRYRTYYYVTGYNGDNAEMKFVSDKILSEEEYEKLKQEYESKQPSTEE